MVKLLFYYYIRLTNDQSTNLLLLKIYFLKDVGGLKTFIPDELCVYCRILLKCTHRVNTRIHKQRVQPFHVGQALCLRTNVHSYAHQKTRAEHANCECDMRSRCKVLSATDAISSDLRQRSHANTSQSQSHCASFMQRAPGWYCTFYRASDWLPP